MTANLENTVLDVVLPWPARALSPNGGHGHYMAKSRARKRYRETCYVLALQERPRAVPADADLRVAMKFNPPCIRNRDQDNLVASMKSGLDGVAQALRVNDTRFRLDEPEHGTVVAGGQVHLRVYLAGGAR